MKRRIVFRRIALPVFSFFLILSLVGLLFHSLFAQRYTQSADTAIAAGKAQLFQRTASGAMNAYQTFQAAAAGGDYSGADAAQKIKIRVYLAVTRMMDLILRNDGGSADTLTELLAQYGVTRTGDAFDGVKFNLPLNDDQKIILPATSPASAEALRSFFAGPFLTAVNASIADLDAAIALCPTSGEGEDREIISKTLIDSGDATQPNVEMDAGDYYLFRAILKFFKTYALMCAGYNAEISIREIVALVNLEIEQPMIKILTDRYPDFLKIRDAANLNEARTMLIDAITDYETASAKIRNDHSVSAGAEELISIDLPDLQREAFVREQMAKIKDSMLNNRAVALGGSEEQWRFTASDTPAAQDIYISFLDGFSDSGSYNAYNNSIYAIYGCNPKFGCWGTRMEYALINGLDARLRFKYSYPYYGWVEFQGTFNANKTQITAGTYTGWNGVMGDYSGTFSAVRTSLKSQTENINLVPLFGHGSTAPTALRDMLPQLNEFGYPVPGTMGHGLGNDPTLGGGLPDFTTQERWIRENEDIFLPTGPLTIPQVSDGAITITGNAADWAGIAPVLTDVTGEREQSMATNCDLQNLFLARDSTYLYIRMDVNGDVTGPSVWQQCMYGLGFQQSPGSGPDKKGDVKVFARNRDSAWEVKIQTIQSSGWYGPLIDLGAQNALAASAGRIVEWRVPLASLGTIAGRFLSVDTNAWYYSSYGWDYWYSYDMNRSCLQIQPAASVSGNLSVPGYDGGPVRIGVFAYGPDFSREPKKRIGSLAIHPDGSGGLPTTYTVANLPVGSKVFMTVHWDRDGNGVVSPGDYTNFYLPFTTVSGNNVRNLTVNDDHPGYPAPRFHTAVVYHEKRPPAEGGAWSAFMAAQLTGPSPDDVAITVTGPGGEYTLTPGAVISKRGLVYKITVPWLPNGDYKFMAVDSLGRKAEATYQYEARYDLPVASNLTPASGSYGGTAPTLSWTKPADGYAYQVWIVDYNNLNNGVTWFVSDITTDTSVTVPSGVLLPDTPYYWFVRLYDRANNPMNYTMSPVNAFYTGAYAAAPVFSSVQLGSRPPTGSNLRYQNWVDAKIQGIAPWQVTAWRLKKGVALVAQGSGAPGFDVRADDSFFSPGFQTDAQLSNGNDYSFEMDINRTVATIVRTGITFSYQSVQAVDLTSLVPSNNYYFKTATPTFSWSPVSDQNTYYRFRIFDPLWGKFTLWRSGWSKDVSVTVPAGVLRPGGNYYWTVMTTPSINPSYVSAYVNTEGNPSNRAMHRFTIEPSQDVDADKTEIQSRFEGLLAEYNKGASGSVSAVMSFFAANYLNDGVDFAAMQARMQQGLSQNPFQPKQPVSVEVNVAGGRATMAVNWGVGSIETLHWEWRIDGVWRIVGNGLTAPITYTGYVADSQSPSQIVSGAMVEQGGFPANSVATDSTGLYTLGNLHAGTPFYLKISKDASYAPCYTAEMTYNANRVDPRDRAFTLFPAERLGPGTGNWNVDAGKGIIRAYVRDKIDGYVGGAVVRATGVLQASYPVCYDDDCTPTLTATKDKDGAGRFVIKNVLDGDTVTVTATKAGWTSNTRIYHTGAGAVSQGRITIQGPVSLVVTANTRGPVGTLLQGALVQVVGFPTVSALTGADGKATLTGLPPNTSIPFSISKEGYVNSYGLFSSTGVSTWIVPLSTQADLNAWGIREGAGVIYGRVINNADSNNSTNSVGGAQVSYTGDQGKAYHVVYLNDDYTIADSATATLANGRYLVLNVVPGDKVTVSARKAGWSFWTRTTSGYTGGVSHNHVYGNIGGAFVSMYVKDNYSVPISGATVRVAENPSLFATTDVNGKITLTNLPLDTPMTFEVMKSGYASTYSRIATLKGNDNDWGTYYLHPSVSAWGVTEGKGAIMGWVRNEADSSALTGAQVTCLSAGGRRYAVAYLNSDGSIAAGATATSSSGRFLILDVEPGDMVVATARLVGWTFQPRAFSARANAVNQSNINGRQYKYPGSARLLRGVAPVNFLAYLRVADPLEAIESITVTGPGVASSLNLTYDSVNQSWRNEVEIGFEVRPSFLPTYTLLVVEKEEITPLRQYLYMTGAGVLSGDVDGNDSVSLADAILSLQAITGHLPAEARVYNDADANGDGRIGIPEAIHVLQEVSGLR